MYSFITVVFVYITVVFVYITVVFVYNSCIRLYRTLQSHHTVRNSVCVYIYISFFFIYCSGKVADCQNGRTNYCRFDLKGNCHEQLPWKRQPDLFKLDSKRYRCKANPPAYNGPLAAKEITPDRKSWFRERTDLQTNCHKRIYLNACTCSSLQFPFKALHHSKVVK